MMLSKKECLEAYEVIDTLIHLMCGETREDGYEPTTDETINSMRILKQLIDKHFEIIKEKECLEKALDKACKELYDNQMSEAGIDEELHGIHPNFINAEEWKEWCMKGD